MTEPDRSLEFEIEVTGTPEEVWRAIATGPGISSWYVPHTVEEREGGVATARFGPGPEMEVPGRVAAWEPPHRVKFSGDTGDEGLAFEWLVEARDGGTCVVRLVNSGFGSGEDWDAQYDGMADGWPMFLSNLRLHLAHFRGQTATASLPSAMLGASRDEAFRMLTGALGMGPSVAVGDRVDLDVADGPRLSGEIVDVEPHRLAILVEHPAPGTAFVAAEGMGDQTGLSIWSYLYGEGGAVAAKRDEPGWQAWLAQLTAG